MPVKRYDPEVKAAFIKAATDARAADKSWAEVFAAAKEAGYKGSVGGIQQALMRKPTGKKLGRPKKVRGAEAPVKPVSGKRRGRPSKAGDGLAGIETVIAELVRERVRLAIKKVITALEAAK